LKSKVESETKSVTAVRLFTNGDLFKLFIPIIVEQFLEYLVGLADSVMVTHVGEAAVSGVSLVDFVMALLISLFAALSTGGAVIAGQYLGRKNIKSAEESVNQLVWFSGVAALVITILVYASKNLILHGLFGEISSDVYNHANTYLLIIAASIPFIALYSAGAAIFRTLGNSRLPMNIMLVMNIVHVAGNALFIYVLHTGTAGVAVSSLVSRAGAAIIIIVLATNGDRLIRLRKTLRHTFDWRMIRMILGIGVPYGFENGMFYLGRLLILSLVATFGTAAIAANAVSGTIVMFQVLPGMSIGLGMTVVISRCTGSGDYIQARYYTRKILRIIYSVHIVSAFAVLGLLPFLLRVYGLSPEASFWVNRLVWSHGLMMILVWPLAYTLPVTFRAAGDAKYPMIVSMLSMIFCRIVLAYVFGIYFGMGMFGTWVAMYVDWIAKAALFVWRYMNGRWTEFRAIRS
jgi:putative MATE family efflux protein